MVIRLFVTVLLRNVPTADVLIAKLYAHARQAGMGACVAGFRHQLLYVAW